MSALGHYLEEEGVPTAGISLVREHTDAMRPPRALWVPFMLGRPLGAPGDPAFQREVLQAVLGLFEEPAGPVLRDFPRDAPRSAAIEQEAGEGEACPVNFGRPHEGRDELPLLAAMAQEIARLQPWHDLAVRRRGGTGLGLSGLSPDEAAAFVVGFLGGSSAPGGPPGRSSAQTLKLACDDLRTFYEEAATAQPGGLSAEEVQQWFYFETVAGDALLALRRAGMESQDPSVRFVAEKVLVPRAVVQRLGR